MINDLWYKNAIFYCLSVATYMDANGDGVGDFQGLLRRLDYLHGMGVTALWLMTFQCSPGRDNGYDVSDYYAVDPRYGTLGDFVEFTRGCKQRGMRVIVDMVVNHTSDQHPWFVESRSSRDNPKRNWYLWHDGGPNGAPPNNWRAAFGGSAWEWDDHTKQYYYHAFLKEQRKAM